MKRNLKQAKCWFDALVTDILTSKLPFAKKLVPDIEKKGQTDKKLISFNEKSGISNKCAPSTVCARILNGQEQSKPYSANSGGLQKNLGQDLYKNNYMCMSQQKFLERLCIVLVESIQRLYVKHLL